MKLALLFIYHITNYTIIGNIAIATYLPHAVAINDT